MNKFLGILIVQNILFFYLVFFIPVSIFLKIGHDYSLTNYFLLIVFFSFVILIFFLNRYLIKNEALSFGFLRFVPFILLMHKFNSILKLHYSDLSLPEYQKQIIVIYFMNKHVLINEEDYLHFSKLFKISMGEGESEFLQLIESTQFFYELHEYSDQYCINRQLLAEKGMVFNEKKFAYLILFCFIAYILLIIILYLL